MCTRKKNFKYSEQPKKPDHIKVNICCDKEVRQSYFLAEETDISIAFYIELYMVNTKYFFQEYYTFAPLFFRNYLIEYG